MSPQGADPSPQDTQRQYARQAEHYADSRLHSRGASLQAVLDLAAAGATETGLDIGTGAGHTAFGLAATARRVVASDLTPEMLHLTRRLSIERGLESRVECVAAAAESLAFVDGAFPLVTCRVASHHFHDLPGALREIARVLAPDGRFVLCDVVAPEGEGLDETMNEWERLRDPTHVWDYRLSQWRDELLPAAGFEVREAVLGTHPIQFNDWVERSGTPGEVVERLRGMYVRAAEETKRAFEVREEGEDISFSWPSATILATKA